MKNTEQLAAKVTLALKVGTVVRLLSSGNTWTEVSRVRGAGAVATATMGRGWIPWSAVRGVRFGGTSAQARHLEEMGAR